MKPRASIIEQLKSLILRKRSLQSRKAAGENLIRREAEELRVSTSELRKFKILACSVVPIGNILAVPILMNPRRYFPLMFWDIKNHVVYREKENIEKLAHQDRLIQLIKSQQRIIDANDLNNLSREHIEALAACHGLCAFRFLYSYLPKSSLVKWLTEVSNELRADDKLLHVEGMSTLSEEEVVDACMRRGLLDRGLFAKHVAEQGQGKDDDDEKIVGDGEIPGLLKRNWDVEALRNKLEYWVKVASKQSTANDSVYAHASALGMWPDYPSVN